jgi:hypothetical protein
MRKVAIIMLLVAVPVLAHADRIDSTLSLLRNSDSTKVRAAAALVLGKQTSQSHRTVRPLMTALGDAEPAVRAAAALALGKLGAVGSLARLGETLEDTDLRVARASKRAIASVVKSFMKTRGGKFKQNRYNFYIAGLSTEARFKDLVMARLLEFENVDVGKPMEFDGDETNAPVIELDLRGEILSMTSTHCTMRITLALKSGDYVVTEWKQIRAKGQTRDDAMAAAAKTAVVNVLGFLGASAAGAK